jgi:putative oxidoreductase
MTGFIDRTAEASNSIVLLIGRLAIAAIFLPSGLRKLADLGAFAHYLAGRGFPAPYAWAVIGAVIEFFGAVLIVVGLKTRWAALLMAAFTTAAALIAHHFWTMEGAARLMNYTQFMKNLAIIGGFLILFAAGPGPLSFDRGRR